MFITLLLPHEVWHKPVFATFVFALLRFANTPTILNLITHVSDTESLIFNNSLKDSLTVIVELISSGIVKVCMHSL